MVANEASELAATTACTSAFADTNGGHVRTRRHAPNWRRCGRGVCSRGRPMLTLHLAEGGWRASRVGGAGAGALQQVAELHQVGKPITGGRPTSSGRGRRALRPRSRRSPSSGGGDSPSAPLRLRRQVARRHRERGFTCAALARFIFPTAAAIGGMLSSRRSSSRAPASNSVFCVAISSPVGRLHGVCSRFDPVAPPSVGVRSAVGASPLPHLGPVP